MAELINASNRQLVPRWHTSRRIELIRQFVPEKLSQSVDSSLFRIDRKVLRWEAGHSIEAATDLFVSLKLANITSTPLYMQVESYLASKQDEVSSAVRNVISPKLRKLDSSNIYETNTNQIFKILSNLKEYVRDCPHDALSWNDLAFYYAVIGESEKAKHCMHVAYNINRNHPFIVRSYARLLVHYKMPDKAVHILKKTGRVRSHPEILSADMAIRTAFDVGKPDISTARKLIKKYANRPDLISELSASIGTLEVESGSAKRGKEHLVISAIAPTENTIAQLQWISQQHRIVVPVESTSIRSLEAEAISFYNQQDYFRCRDALMTLHEFQPFTEGALADAGYISMVALDDPRFVCDFTAASGYVIPNGFSALNNYVVAKLILDERDDMEAMLENLSRLASQDEEKSVLLATFGMYLYRIGEFDGAREQYEKCESFFRVSKNHFKLGLALLHHGLIEKQLGIDSAISLLELAKKEAKKVSNAPELLGKINRELMT